MTIMFVSIASNSSPFISSHTIHSLIHYWVCWYSQVECFEKHISWHYCCSESLCVLRYSMLSDWTTESWYWQASTSVLGLRTALYSMNTVALAVRFKELWCEADLLPPSSAEVKIAWSPTHIFPCSFIAWCLINHTYRIKAGAGIAQSV
jgi:hypothetical protein